MWRPSMEALYISEMVLIDMKKYGAIYIYPIGRDIFHAPLAINGYGRMWSQQRWLHPHIGPF